jgi:D-alanyl-D-alanine dipeptidase
MRWLLLSSVLILFLIACSPNREEQVCMDDSHGFELLDSLEKAKHSLATTASPKKSQDGGEVGTLIDIQQVNSAIRVELKYASSDNFMHEVMYAKIRHAYLQKDVAIRLSNCQDWLSKNYPGLHLLVYDAARPVEVQQRMWDALDSIPVKRRINFVSNPANLSLHNYGAAVDLTICTKDGKPLDMGAEYDDMREIAYPRYEKRFLATAQLSKSQFENREILRKALRTQQFNQLSTEWWHFNACSRSEARKNYTPLKREVDLTEY